MFKTLKEDQFVQVSRLWYLQDRGLYLNTTTTTTTITTTPTLPMCVCVCALVTNTSFLQSKLKIRVLACNCNTKIIIKFYAIYAFSFCESVFPFDLHKTHMQF